MNVLKKLSFVFVLFFSSAIFAFKASEFASILDSSESEEEIRKTSQEVLDEKLVGAAKKGSAQEIQALLCAGAYVDARDAAEDYGNTALICAAEAGHDEIVKILLNAGADICNTSCMGNTALHEAALQGHAGIAQTLLNAGVDARVVNYMGKTARDYAKERGHKNIDVLIKDHLQQITGSAGSGVTQEDYNDQLIDAAIHGNAEVIKTCLAAGANVEATACDLSVRKTALMLAAEKGNAEAVKALIAGGANIDAADDFGWTSLLSAIDKGHTGTVRILLAAGAAEQCDVKKLRECLASAAFRGNKEVVDLVQSYLEY